MQKVRRSYLFGVALFVARLLGPSPAFAATTAIAQSVRGLFTVALDGQTLTVTPVDGGARSA